MTVTDLLMMRHAEQTSRPGTHEAERLVDLTDHGRHQARLLAQRLEGEPPFACLASSPFRRATETARYIAETRPCPITLCDDLGELVPDQPRGMERRLAWEGAAISSLGLRDFHARCTRQVEELARRFAGERIGLVVHGGVIKMFFLHALGIPVERCLDIQVKIDHACIFHWRQHLTSDRVYWELLSANDTSHLR